MNNQVLRTLCPAALALLTFAAPARAEVYEYYDHSYLPHFSLNLRAGGTIFTDEGLDDLYDSAGTVGTDFKFHLYDLPLAVQTGFDFSGADGDPRDIGSVGDDIALYLFNWRVSLLLEPPPGVWGDPRTGFYVQPYVGGGIGVHYAEEEVRSVGFFIDEEADTAGLGYHAMAGIDFVFAYNFSVGVEAVYTDATFNTPKTHLDLSAFTISANFKMHF